MDGLSDPDQVQRLVTGAAIRSMRARMSRVPASPSGAYLTTSSSRPASNPSLPEMVGVE